MTEPTPFDLDIFPHARRSLPQLLLDHNPCFLLSTLSMLLGCYLLNSALDVRAGDAAKLLGLIGTINAYEFAIIFLGLALLRRTRGIARDGMWLLLFEALFLLDGSFLLAETVQADPRWGLQTNLALLVLAIFKSVLILAGMRLKIRPRTVGFLALQLAFIYLLPVFLERTAINGNASPLTMLAAWCVAAALVPLYELLAQMDRLTFRCDADLATVQQAIRRAYVILPFLLVVAHVAFMHYVYHADLYAVQLAPICLALALATLRLRPMRFLPATDLRILRFILPLTAILLACADHDALFTFHLRGHAISAAALTTAAALLFWAYCFSWKAATATLITLLLAAIAYHIQPWVLATARSLLTRTLDASHAAQRLLPHTPAGWGITAIAAAFLLLLTGALLSFRRPAAPSPP